ncbi:hypothetical protein [Paramicrobacterium chengjingii]|uniref:Uncharacterized protein n=1 Tax=Paramicrobacterium chengjingii TaxID=2769067 RepID=A0ABX6YMB5_9MICO|nr:hypothetical protein [Microbacterium chengjingii]QPZ39526.1 hypothetical protein HCR76_05575 [Microbacterium chengjingii]
MFTLTIDRDSIQANERGPLIEIFDGESHETIRVPLDEARYLAACIAEKALEIERERILRRRHETTEHLAGLDG